MSNYAVSLKSSAAKELKKLPQQLQKRVAQALEKLRNNPRCSGVVKLKGDNNLYRFRVGEYRIVYVINELEQKITITRIRHRRDVYR